MNPITQLRAKRAKSRRAPMPVSKKPRRRYRDRPEAKGPNPYTVAGTLFYSWYEHAARAKLNQASATVDQMQRHTNRQARTRRGKTTGCWTHAGPESREAQRRRGQNLTQHPSVVARFKNHPTRAQIEAAAAA